MSIREWWCHLCGSKRNTGESKQNTGECKQNTGTGCPQKTTHWWILWMAVGLYGLFILTAADAWGVLNSGFALVSLALACFFPISAIVYEISHRDIRRTEIEKDLNLLNPETKKKRLESCESFYAHWHYAMHYLLAMVLTIERV